MGTQPLTFTVDGKVEGFWKKRERDRAELIEAAHRDPFAAVPRQDEGFTLWRFVEVNVALELESIFELSPIPAWAVLIAFDTYINVSDVVDTSPYGGDGTHPFAALLLHRQSRLIRQLKALPARRRGVLIPSVLALLRLLPERADRLVAAEHFLAAESRR